MNIFYLIGILLIFCGFQYILSKNTNSPLIKYLPIGATILGLLFAFVLYIGVFGTYSPSVIAENQYFAKFISLPLGAGFIGCLLGLLIYKLLKDSRQY